MVAVNKIDKEGADPNRVRGELAQQGLTPADWGGDTEFCDVSAKTREGLDRLLDDIVTIAEIQELKANPAAEASGAVIESRLDPGRGPVVSLLVQRGTLHVGDALVAGAHWGRVRAMHDYRGERMKQALPGRAGRGARASTACPRPVSTSTRSTTSGGRASWRASAPTASRPRRSHGARACSDLARGRLRPRPGGRDHRAQPDRQGRRRRLPGGDRGRDREAAPRPGVGQRDPRRCRRDQRVRRDARLGLRRDHHGLQRPPGAGRAPGRRARGRRDPHLLRDLPGDRGAAGGDGGHAGARGGGVDGRPPRGPADLQGLAGRARSPAATSPSGTVRRGAAVRLVRDGRIVYDGRIGSLRRFKDDVREVQAGFECGIVLENFADVKEGDVLEVYETQQIDRQL